MSVRDDIAELVSARTGIEVTRGGIDRAVQGFVQRRSRELRIAPELYLALVSDAKSSELERLINAVTVGFTWFFRDAGQLTTIEALFQSALGRGRPLRVWVPGCSTGEDAYSLALINSQSVQHARRGAYGSFSLRELDPRSASCFSRQPDGTFEISDEVRARVSFAHHNLVDRPPAPTIGALWDIVLCRNVLIYFTRAAALATLASLSQSLSLGG
jgi:chemotaxis methyl-accepting protein methylase